MATFLGLRQGQKTCFFSDFRASGRVKRRVFSDFRASGRVKKCVFTRFEPPAGSKSVFLPVLSLRQGKIPYLEPPAG